MAILMFALIGAAIKGGVAYWICFGLYCAICLGKAIYKTFVEDE